MASETYRCTFTLPVELAREISETAQALGVSQSALVTQVLQDPLGRLAMYLSMANPVSVDTVTRRLTGQSRQVIEDLIQDALSRSLVVRPDPLL